MMPPAQGEIVLKNMKQMSFLGLPKSFRQIFKLEPPSEVVMGDIQLRIQKINRIENVAQASFMIRNRLQYGTGFRADIITLSDIKGFNMRGNQIAKLLCTNDSTVSRILNDLKASKFLSRDNKKIRPTDNYPGLFISSQTLWNICELIDAFQFSREELKQAALEGLDFKHDGFGKKYIPPL